MESLINEIMNTLNYILEQKKTNHLTSIQIKLTKTLNFDVITTLFEDDEASKLVLRSLNCLPPPSTTRIYLAEGLLLFYSNLMKGEIMKKNTIRKLVIPKIMEGN
jgi:hypothetical protein